MEIGLPSCVRHITHVTFDRLNGFLGLPVEFELEIPRRVPSASANVFGVSAESMQCSYDGRGNSVPTILLLLQNRLYDQGGLRTEGIFRINPENSQEEHVRDRLNKGIVPYDIDVHCLAGLIKAWFRELPKGVMDSLSPEQVMQCCDEDQCVALVKSLPLTQASLMDWAINLMTDVVQEESFNKMNARNIAVVFAPNMTHMSDPLTALMHAVQVMNLLKTLILKTLKDRDVPGAAPRFITWMESPFRTKDENMESLLQGPLAIDPSPEAKSIKGALKKEGLPNSESMAKVLTESEIAEEDGSACGSEWTRSTDSSTRGSKGGSDHGFDDHRVVVLGSACDGVEGKDVVRNLSGRRHYQASEKPLGAWLDMASLHAIGGVHGDEDAFSDDKTTCPLEDGLHTLNESKHDHLRHSPCGQRSHQPSHKPLADWLHQASSATVVSQPFDKARVLIKAETPIIKMPPAGGSIAMAKCHSKATGAVSRRTRHLISKGPV